MTTFVQQVEGARPVGIGDQRVLKQDQSHIASIGRAVDTAFQSFDEIGTAVGKQKAKDLVASAQAEVDAALAGEEEELTFGDDSALNEVASKAARYERGVSQGSISRETARLHVANAVTKGIEENPLFANKIRKAATNLLGFNPESEGVRQFFGAFQPAGTTSKLSAREKQAQFMADNSNGKLSLSASRHLIAQAEEVGLRKQLNQDRLALGDVSADQFLAESSIDDDIEGTQAIFGDALRLTNEGEEINADTWAQLAAKRENAFVAATLQQYRDSGIAISSAQEAKVRENAKGRYDRLSEQLSRFDQGFLNKQNLDRLVTAQKLFGAKAMPVFSTLVNSFGDRIGSQILDLYANAAGKPERLEAALGANPALVPFVTMLKQDPKGFTDRMNQSLLKLNGTSSDDLSPEDVGFIDLFLNTTVKKAAPKDRATVIEKLANMGVPTKAASVLAQSGRTAATPEEIAFMKREWELVNGTSPNTVANKIKQGNRTLTDRGARLELNPDGNNLVLYQGINPITQEPQQATGHPAWPEIQKINTFLNAARTGWGNDLKINNPQAIAKQFMDQINGSAAQPSLKDLTKGMSPERIEELREIARRRAGGQ